MREVPCIKILLIHCLVTTRYNFAFTCPPAAGESPIYFWYADSADVLPWSCLTRLMKSELQEWEPMFASLLTACWPFNAVVLL